VGRKNRQKDSPIVGLWSGEKQKREECPVKKKKVQLETSVPHTDRPANTGEWVKRGSFLVTWPENLKKNKNVVWA